MSAAGKKKSVGPRNGGTYVARAQERWGTVPDWVMQLAIATDMLASNGASMADLAQRIGCVPSAISAAIGKTYMGRYDHLEACVRGKLMSATVSCPVMGTIGRDICAQNQKLPFSAASPERARLYRACRSGCPNAIGGTNAES